MEKNEILLLLQLCDRKDIIISKRVWELLCLINPYRARPMSQKQAAKSLNISIDGVKYRMRVFKTSCPVEYAKFKDLCSRLSAGQKAIDKAWVTNKIDELQTAMREDKEAVLNFIQNEKLWVDRKCKPFIRRKKISCWLSV